jgi:hypothetical protein|tara:strand:+ start:132 stop:1010 length:879 start_codon:yes stop_codon:yes gene_type:complete
MANSTFSGPIRSENGMKLISKNTTSGLISDRTLGTPIQDARRVYFDEWFLQRPGLNANIDQVSTVEVQRALNRNWEALGTNVTTALVTFASTSAGVLATTAGADQDQAILTPHLDTAATAWAGTKWGTENETHFETSIMLPAIDNQKVWAGLKLTNDQLVATDDDQIYFKFQTDATNSEAFTDFTKWHFVHSIGGTDYISQLPITVAANTPYHLKITIDSDRKASIFVNGVQYNVTTTSGSTGGTAVTTGTTPSTALTDDIDLIPYVGIEAGAAAAEAVNCHYVCCSRNVYE